MSKACAGYPGRVLMECPMMLARSIAIAATLATAALAAPGAFAEPPKPQVREAGPVSARPIVLASADALKPTPAAADQQAPAKRPRVARVTTCRCGNQLPQEDSEQQ
jgi:hypothetical protein